MEQSKTNTANRPTLADFGAMLADAVRDFGVMHLENGTMDEVATANEILERMGDLAEELAINNLSTTGIIALFDAVKHYTLSARDEMSRITADHAAKALIAVLTVWGLLKDYNSELWQFSKASANYIEAIRKQEQ